MEIISSAPGRCGIVGNPTDMYGGSVLSLSVRERATCRLMMRQSKGINATNEDDHAIFTNKSDLILCGDKLDILRAALTFFALDLEAVTLNIHLSTDIPMKAGMAGSTAMLASIVGAFDALLGLKMSPYALAETTRKIEARVMGVVCGHQDQHMAIFGGLNFMDFAGKESLTQSEEEPFATVEPLGAFFPNPPFILAHTGKQHHSGTVHRSPRERWLAGEPLVRQSYLRIAELARHGKRALLQNNLQLLGKLMNENHALVRELGGSGEENDRLIGAALDAGAYGAKLAGAGGGGTIIALTDNLTHVGDALTKAGSPRLLYPSPVEGLRVTQSD